MFSRQQGVDDEAIAQLPSHLRYEIAWSLHGDVVKKIPLFEGTSEGTSPFCPRLP